MERKFWKFLILRPSRHDQIKTDEDVSINPCKNQGGRLLCPLNLPFMCADCNGSFCCARREVICENQFGGLLTRDQCPTYTEEKSLTIEVSETWKIV